MIFRKSLRRDLANLAGVVFASLFTIMVTTSLIRVLRRATGGQIDTAGVLPLIAYASINFLPVLLVLTLYVSVLIALTRAWRDSEMVVWFASGQSLLAFIRPVLVFALPFAVGVGVVGFAVAPWANRQTNEYQQRFEQREDVSQVSAGQFRESAGANRVFFVESLAEDAQSVRNVFVAQGKGDAFSVVVAAGGAIEQAQAGRFLVLERGRRYDGTHDSAELRLTEFERYGLRLDARPATVSNESPRTLDTPDLLRNPTDRNLGELSWRIGLPVSALLLALLAIPMSFVNPRMGRSGNLVVALLAYVLYNNLLSLTQAYITQGRLPFWIGVWLVHALLALLVAWAFRRRVRMVQRPWRQRLRAALAGQAARAGAQAGA